MPSGCILPPGTAGHTMDFVAKTKPKPKAEGPRRKIVAENRTVPYKYHILDRLEAGMVLSGTEVKALREGRVPPETLEAGRRIVAAASAAGLYDLDISTKNIKVRKTEAGWMPVVYDFNLVPQYLYPPNPLLALAYWTGFRSKSHRDRRAIRNWVTLKKA